MFARVRRTVLLGLLMLSGMLLGVMPVVAEYNRTPESDINPEIFVIDEPAVLGTKIDRSVALVDENGKDFLLGDMLGQPLIIVLSYYTCDGSCSVINSDLANLLKDVDLLRMGEDFKVLTLSFDKEDTIETLVEFRNHLEFDGLTNDNWVFANFKNEEDIKTLTERFGYSYFWSPMDRIFFHPGTFLVFTPKGRLARVLYSLNASSDDVELAVLEAREGKFDFKPKDLINYAISLCYSYNYKEGQYTYNIPMFVAIGALTVGISLFSGSALVFRRRRQKEEAV
jgi:protein SCO1